MDDALLVRRFERFGDLARDRQRLADIERAARDPLGQRLALDQLQHEHANAVRLFQPIDRCDVRMIERRQQPRLAVEPRQPLRIAREDSGRTLIATSRPSFVSRAR